MKQVSLSQRRLGGFYEDKKNMETVAGLDFVGGDDFHIQFFAAPSRVEGIVEAMLFESDVIVWILGVFVARGKHGQEQHGSGGQLADCFHVVYNELFFYN